MTWTTFMVTVEEQRLKKMNITRRKMESALARLYPCCFPTPFLSDGFAYQNAKLCEDVIPVLSTNERIKPEIKICDADLNILHADASFGGASHDSHVWNMCPVNPATHRLHDEGQNFWLLGDSGYAQRPWMMTPIFHAELNSSEVVHHTSVHVRTQNVVERTFFVRFHYDTAVCSVTASKGG